MIYKVFADDMQIGESKLENGDAPMGVAFGVMLPNENYWEYQVMFEEQDFDKIEALKLKVISDKDELLEPCAGVGIEDLSKEAGKTCIVLNVLGLDSQLYEKHFPHHVKAYEARFK